MTLVLAVLAAIAVVLAVYAAVRGHRASAMLAGSRAETEQLRAQTERLRADTEQLRAQCEQLRAKDAVCQLENEELGVKVTQLGADLDASRRETGELRKERDQLSADADALGAEAEQLRADADALRMETEQLSADADALGAEAEQLRARALRAGGEHLSAYSEQSSTDREEDRTEPLPPAQATVLWGLERVRLEREWHDIAGAAAPAPVSWDDPVAAALAIELELIRESIGTPSQLEVAPGRIRAPGQSIGTPSRPAPPPGSGPELVSGCSSHLLCAVPAVRLVAEALRRLAHVGEELLVHVGQSDVQVTVAVAPGTERPDLGELAQLAVAAGALVELTMADETLQLTVDMVQDEEARAVE